MENRGIIKNPKIRLHASEVIKAISYDPSWALSLKEPIEIVDFVNLGGSRITHLSEKITFSGKNSQGFCASFKGCSNIKTALGKFLGAVDFSESGIENIPSTPHLFEVAGKAKNGLCADFSRCRNLKLATGKYPGAVKFCESGVEDICELEVLGTISQEDRMGSKLLDEFCASFFDCEELKYASGTFHGLVDFSASGITHIKDDLSILNANSKGFSAKFLYCQNLNIPTGNYPGAVSFAFSNIKTLDPKKLVIQKANNIGKKINLEGCNMLKEIPLGFNPQELVIDENLYKNHKLKESLLNNIKKNEQTLNI
jgi:hypothetical protein